MIPNLVLLTRTRSVPSVCTKPAEVLFGSSAQAASTAGWLSGACERSGAEKSQVKFHSNMCRLRQDSSKVKEKCIFDIPKMANGRMPKIHCILPVVPQFQVCNPATCLVLIYDISISCHFTNYLSVNRALSLPRLRRSSSLDQLSQLRL